MPQERNTSGSEAPAARPLSFWAWFLRGKAGDPGWHRLVDWWLLGHLLTGIALALLVPMNVEEAARAVLLPLAGIFVGMSFAWVGSAQAIAQSNEIDKLADKHPAGFETYVYPFQTAILGLLVTLGFWGIAGLGVFDRSCPWDCPSAVYLATAALLYALASLTVRLCWQVVLGAQWLLLYQRAVRRIPEK
jgi:hypothetical protein